MRYVVTSAQVTAFRTEGEIEFTELFSEQALANLRDLLNASTDNGYELQRRDPAIAQAMRLPKLAQIAGQLTHQARIRIGFTQFKPSHPPTTTLDAVSSLTDVEIGALVNLDSEPTEECPLPIGHALFISAQKELVVSHLPANALLVVFAGEKARYRHTDSDPHTHYLKKMGYGFGDKITVETHPLISCSV